MISFRSLSSRLAAAAILVAAVLSYRPGAKAQGRFCPDPFNSAPCTAVTATGTGTTAASATLAAVVGKTTYICGFQATTAGTTAGTVTIANTITGSLNYTLSGTTPLVVNFVPCVPATGVNTTIVVTGAFTGGTASSINAIGLQL